MSEHTTSIALAFFSLFSTGGFFYMIYSKRAERQQTELENELDSEKERQTQNQRLAKELSEAKIMNAQLIERDKYKDDLMEKLILLFIAENPDGSEKFQSWLKNIDDK